MPDENSQLSNREVSQRRLNDPQFEIQKTKLCLETPSLLELQHIVSVAKKSIASNVTIEHLSQLITWNPSILISARFKNRASEENKASFAFMAILPLNQKGVEALFDGNIDLDAPSLEYISRGGEEPKAVYVWAIYCPGRYLLALPLFKEYLQQVPYHRCPKFARPINQKVEHLFSRIGWSTGVDWNGFSREDLMYYNPPETAESQAIVKDVRLVRNFEELHKVFSLRSATYIREQDCPYAEEFDGNDFCAAHVLATVNGDPAACLRIRFFKDFVKLERVAVAAPYRRLKLVPELIRLSVEYVAKKGFTKIYGHSRADLKFFWEKLGFSEIKDRPAFDFSKQKYIEVEADISRHPEAISMNDNPYKILRPEGDWDRPGILEASLRDGADFGDKFRSRLELMRPSEFNLKSKSEFQPWKTPLAQKHEGERQGRT